MSSLTRRGFLATGLATVVAPAAFWRSAKAEDGTIELTAKPFEKSIPGGGAPASTLWGYQDQVPGPLLRARQGETLRIRFRNELPEPSSIHWHGVRVDNSMDGVAGLTQAPVPPGDTFDYEVNLPDAGTFWYHAHTKSWDQVARGLYGPLIVEERAPTFTPEADILLMLDDWRLDAQGRFDAASLGNMMDWSHAGRLGNYLTVNGMTSPDISVPANTWLRLRLINACNSRILEIDPNRFSARVIAYDGQAIGEARELDYAPLLLGPAQRVDLLVRFDTPGPVALEELSQSSAYRFATLNVADNETRQDREPTLPPNLLPAPDLRNAQMFELLMEGGAMGQMSQLTYNGRAQTRMDFMANKQVWGFNGVANMADEPFFSVARGQSVIVNVVNRTSFPHAMHTHGHHFKLLERNGQAGDEQIWRDTFLIEPDGMAKIAFVADNPGKWLFHCHMLEHAAAGMTTWFEIT
ncbi:multicopper oxidase family protein [Afifella sp. IM 167]|uniref:multicopper oxidase family protein n=1 Tax=Afifella sp. IM 167 TaxID=2033586 RepID=UPI001CCD8BEB|nr:multicopper oxidase family protein [Afifella sp. IM 167]MBZ8134071.1 copper oxidase [Afifella sp. IM 167]